MLEAESNYTNTFHFLFRRSEYGAFWKCIQAGGLYIFTQLTKMLLLATFFPDSESLAATGDFNVIAVSVVT